VVTKSTMYCSTKTYAFSAEFNSAIRKILKHGNWILVSILCLNLLTYELSDKQIKIFKGGGRCLEQDPIWHSLSSCRQLFPQKKLKKQFVQFNPTRIDRGPEPRSVRHDS
jgi:hypothetical protein